MYATCLFCHAFLGTNEVIAAFPVGERLAFDAAKGRLWVVCPSCGRWNLSPLDERWEAIEACERAFRDTRARVSTENVGLARLRAGLDLVRIGEPLRPEFAAWRYGAQFMRRRQRALAVAATGVAVSGFAFATGFGSWVPMQAMVGGIASLAGVATVGALRDLRRWLRAASSLGASDRRLLGVSVRELRGARLVPTGGEAPASRQPSGWAVEIDRRGARTRLEGPAATRAAGILLTCMNSVGAPAVAVESAVGLLDASGDPARYLAAAPALAGGHARAPGGSAPVASAGTFGLSSVERLALEMAVHEETERAALEGELALLEQAWRDAEELARIADTL